MPDKGTYSFGFDQFLKTKEGSIEISLSIFEQQGTMTTLEITVNIVNGIELHGVKVGFDGTWTPAPAPFNDIVTQDDWTFTFTVILEGITINIAPVSYTHLRAHET